MPSDAESRIRRRVQEYVDAHNAGDAKAAAAVYAPDAFHTYASGVTDRGRDAIEQGLAALYAGPWKGTQLALHVNAIRFIGDVAVEEESFEVRGLRGDDQQERPPMRGSTMMVWTRQDGDWYVAAGHGMVPFPPKKDE